MLALKWLSLLTLAAFATADVPELVIDKTYVPTNCTVKSAKGDEIRVQYTGKLTNGNKFDSSGDRGRPWSLTLGAGEVILGWEEGLLDMCLNEKRVLTIPSRKGFGRRGFGPTIPPNSALVFDIELVELRSTTHDES